MQEIHDVVLLFLGDEVRAGPDHRILIAQGLGTHEAPQKLNGACWVGLSADDPSGFGPPAFRTAIDVMLLLLCRVQFSCGAVSAQDGAVSARNISLALLGYLL